jgi:hypothetical protein
MPGDVFKHLKKVWVSGQQLRITRADEAPETFRGGGGGGKHHKGRK